MVEVALAAKSAGQRDIEQGASPCAHHPLGLAQANVQQDIADGATGTGAEAGQELRATKRAKRHQVGDAHRRHVIVLKPSAGLVDLAIAGSDGVGVGSRRLLGIASQRNDSFDDQGLGSRSGTQGG